MVITLKDLLNIIQNATRKYINTPSGQKLPDMNRTLSNQELVALAYFESVVQYLVSKGELAEGTKFNTVLLNEDSIPAIDDYE